MSHAPSQPDAPPELPAASDPAAPVTCRLATTRGPRLPAREQPEPGEKERQHLQRRARGTESVFNLGSGLEHMVKDHNSLEIFLMDRTLNAAVHFKIHSNSYIKERHG